MSTNSTFTSNSNCSNNKYDYRKIVRACFINSYVIGCGGGGGGERKHSRQISTSRCRVSYYE